MQQVQYLQFATGTVRVVNGSTAGRQLVYCTYSSTKHSASHESDGNETDSDNGD